jgi:site-specific recombinase XerD
LKEPREAFKTGKINAQMEWVRGFYDLRHFRATQWLMRGVDLYTVKTYLGHKRIETTQRYLHFVQDHAEKSVRAAQASEMAELGRVGDTVGDTSSDSEFETKVESA